jgi:peptidoglycan-associated lipoprotein
MRRFSIILLLGAFLAVCGCAHKRPTESPTASSGGATSGTGADTSGAGADNAAGGARSAETEIAGPQEGVLARRIIYFDFDSSEIRGEGTDIVAAHAKYLTANPSLHVRLEGHTDERGSREYNIGLGERRAQAVRRALLLQGASDQQITTVSYGAERPAVAGSDEAAWAKNRRVEIVYLK